VSSGPTTERAGSSIWRSSTVQRAVKLARSSTGPVGIILAVFLIAVLVGALDGSAKGDDAFLHMANARFLSDNFPFVWWTPGPHSGEPGLLTYPLAYYALLGGLDRLSVDLGLVLKVTLLAGLSFSGIAVYWFARRCGLDRLTGAGLGILLATSPMVWNWAVVGGAYIRLAALPFACVAIGCAYLRVADGSRSTRSVLLLIASMGATAVIHPLVFQFTGTICATILFLGTPGWLARLVELAKVAVGIGAVAAWQYAPLMGQVFGSGNGVADAVAHDTTTMRGVWLFVFPQRGEWSITLGPVLFAVACIALVFMAAYLPRLRRLRFEHRAEWAFLMTMVGWSVYFGVLAWIDVPDNLYLMAAYDHVLWLTVTLTFTAVAIAARVVAIWPEVRPVLGRPLVVLASASALAIVPWLQSFVSDSDPEMRASFSYATRQAVENGLASSSPAYRVGAASRTFTRWLPWSYPDVEYLGGRSSISPNRYYYEWMLYDVFLRTHGEELDSVYFEDRPRVTRLPLGDRHNVYSSLFFLKWFGVDQVLLDTPFTPMDFMSQLYEARPQFFRTKRIDTRFGAIKIATPRKVQPITVTTGAPLIAIPFADEVSEEPYRALIELFSSLDLGPGTAVPVSFDGGEGLSEVDVTVVDAETFDRHRSSLTSFAEQGGRVVIASDGPRPVTDWVALTSGTVMHLPVTYVGDVDTSLARASGGVVAGCSTQGLGKICRMGVSLPTLASSPDATAALLLSKTLGLGISIDNQSIRARDLKITYATEGTGADVSTGRLSSPESIHSLDDWNLGFASRGAGGEVTAADEGTILRADFASRPKGQVNFSSPLVRSVPAGVPGHMRFRAETELPLQIDVAFKSRDRFVARPVMLKPGSHEYVVPIGNLLRGSGLGSFEEVVVTLKPPVGKTRDYAVVQILDASLRYWAEGEDHAVVQISLDHRNPNNQVNVGATLLRGVPVDGRGVIRFRLYNDGSPLKNLTLIAGDNERRRFLERILLEDSTWSGWRSFSAPLASLARKTKPWPRTIESIDVILNFDRPQGRSLAPSFAVSDLELVTATALEDVRSVPGAWVKPTSYEADLQVAKSTFLWKENYLPSWRAASQGQRKPHLFAGPGMVAIPASASDQIQIEQPVPGGLAKGAVSSLGLSAALAIWLTTEARRRRGRRAVSLTDVGKRSQ
jgi:hypothetical protein